MGWSWTTAAAGDDWQDRAYIKELYEAWNERRVAIGQSAVTVPAAGDYASSVALFADVQQWIETNCSTFARSHNADGTARADAYWDGQVIADASLQSTLTWSVSTLRQSAGLNASGFTRLTGSGTSYGIAQAGDYVAATLFNELRACLDRLIWVYRKIITSSTATYRQGFGSTFAAAQSSYAAASTFSGSLLPYIAYAESKRDGTSSYILTRAASTTKVTESTAKPCAIDWYYHTVKWSSAGFEAHGDSVTEGEFVCFDQSASSSGPYPRSSSTAGNVAAAASFTDPGAVSFSGVGYYLHPYAIIRWEFDYQ